MTEQTHNGKPTRLFFLVGPTAVGKTELALRAAEELDAEILSCDAYCVYKGMDIGTAKPTRAEQARVPHWGLDLVPVSQAYSVHDYAVHAAEKVREITSRGRAVLIAGGSGFYLKSFFAPVTDAIRVPREISGTVAAMEAGGGLEALCAALRPLAVGVEDRIDWNNPRRVARALERCLASGQDLAGVLEAFSAMPTPFPEARKDLCLLTRPRAELHERIAARVDAMIGEGLVDEVEQLREAGIEGNPTASAAIGYRETLGYLRGEIAGLAELAEQITMHTRQLARKQETWFRRQVPVDRVVEAKGAEARALFSCID